jgi:hypothetical protein
VRTVQSIGTLVKYIWAAAGFIFHLKGVFETGSSPMPSVPRRTLLADIPARAPYKSLQSLTYGRRSTGHASQYRLYACLNGSACQEI